MKLIDSFDELFSTFLPVRRTQTGHPHFNSTETFERGRSLAFSSAFTYGMPTTFFWKSSKNVMKTPIGLMGTSLQPLMKP